MMIGRHYQETHTHLLQKALDKFEKRLPRKINSIKKEDDGELLGSSISQTVNVFCESIVAEKDHLTILRFLTFAKELGAANFASVMRMEETFDVHLLGETITLTGAHKACHVDTDVWLKSFYCAQILRDSAAIDVLNEVDETVFFAAEIKPDALDLRIVDLMQGIYKGHKELTTLLNSALQAEPEDSRLSYAFHLLNPLLSIIRTIFTPGADAEFNKEVREAVELHKKYWGQEDEKWAARGWVSLPLIAMAALAYDHKGYELDFETDYIPDWLVKKQF
ncbi:hypothetical protein DU002_11270 [Corallincola holothuriorum]|uniref:Immunity protein 49 n=1 Tax=Corallincola holothuriorum TaxID=2282215 RepID=A0A368NIC9_9GAMM|nr:immunity 49 family protein [Corallincola holothuriorum]RCU49495.1 hypothetical protein DU002_11270 [Corallincola holothuriorum]